MSRWEFMRRLEELLTDIPPGEREEALQYYNDYINDGGKENEAEVLGSLGSPEQVAATIKEGLEGTAGEFTEKGYYSTYDKAANPIARYQPPASEIKEEYKEVKKEEMSGGVIALIVILCIIGSPAIIGAASGIFGLIVACFATIFSLVVAFAAVSVVLIAVAIILLVLGIPKMLYAPLTGLAMIAAALIVAGVGILFLLLTALLVGKVIPAIAKGIGYLFNKLFNRKGGKK